MGLETSLGLTMELVHQGIIDLARLVELMSVNPARILNVPGGTLAQGSPADITIIDPEAAWTVDPALFKSKGRSTPFAGRSLKGRAALTITDGRITHNML